MALGFVVHSIGSIELGVKPTGVLAANDMPMPGNCDGCDQDVMIAACAAHCCGIVASPVTIALPDRVPVDVLVPTAGRQASGHIGPPDPYPPRPIGTI